jgi:hypothetical protein
MNPAYATWSQRLVFRSDIEAWIVIPALARDQIIQR